MKVNLPELLSPAGDMESLISAVRFGADAVYLAGTQFGMRTAPPNFAPEQLRGAVAFAHKNGVKVYLTCNTLPRNDELPRLREFLPMAADCGVDAFIAADLGTLSFIKKHAPGVAVHISTQAGVTNSEAANAFYEMGARRIIPARELSLKELRGIRENTPDDLELECFVHGAMCVSFSGRCLLSNYMTGRDSNRGDCAQPCRWKYALVEETRPGEYFPVDENSDGTYILNARDLCMIGHIPELIDAGISSFKIEGRAKSFYYVSVITNAYRCAIDAYSRGGLPPKWVLEEVYRVSHREYCTGFFFGPPSANAEIFRDGGYRRYCELMATVVDCDGGTLYCEQRNKFFAGDELEALEPGKPPRKFVAANLCAEDGEPIESTPHPKMRFTMNAPIAFDAPFDMSEGTILRKIIT
ncbi:MAG: U32 family peptidase [Oscillospiraceae bacterium]|nr:U32 family peptidase [Oscillospiraceae bacterium]